MSLLVAVVLQGNSIYAQDTIPKIFQDSALQKSTGKFLSPVEIRPLDQFGYKSEKTDSVFISHYSSGTVADLLNQNGLVLVKSYGGGSLATTSIRGASASQTPVMWNGINLQSPTNGNVDLSLLPVILFDDVSLQNGANSSQYGSGAIGGVINTNSNLFFTGEKLWTIKYSGLAGSFGEINNGIKIGFSNYRFSTDIRAYRQQSKNDFTFNNSAVVGSPLDTLINGDFLQEGIQFQGKYSINYHNIISVRCWYQESDRGIAPSMFETNGVARQTDKFLRSMVAWEHLSRRFKLGFKSVALTEFMEYDQGFSVPVSITKGLSLINEFTIDYWLFERIKLTTGISDTWNQAEVTQYLPLTNQNRASVFANVCYVPTDKMIFSLTCRVEELNGKVIPLVGALGFQWMATEWFKIQSSISRSYRIPTFNDLYWQPGGNTDLKPEDSWNEELTGNFKWNFKKINFNYSVTGFNRNTTNWIQWTPGAAYWSPQNLLSVWSRGVEHRLKINSVFGKWKLNVIGGYDYVRATNEKSAIPSDPSIGKQLMYLPADKWNAMIQVDYRNFYLSYLHQFTNLRFTATDHSSYLPAYSLDQVTIGKRIDVKNSNGDIFFRINNLFDIEYQAVAFRAMPGRYFQMGISIDFNKKTEQ